MKGFVRICRALRRSFCLVCLLLIPTLFSPAVGFAQLSTASINGRVVDPSGAVVPNTSVVLHNVDTSVENTTVSNGAGIYAFLNITPGNYTLKATATGFTPAEVPSFT